MPKECLQIVFGPTPCFANDAANTVCSLEFCPVQSYLEQNPAAEPWKALHTHCVMSDGYGQQDFCGEGRGEFVATIARLKIQKKPF